jgi:hypothetical protein
VIAIRAAIGNCVSLLMRSGSERLQIAESP